MNREKEYSIDAKNFLESPLKTLNVITIWNGKYGL